MKKIKAIMLMLLLALGLASCGEADNYTISFDMNGYGQQVEAITNQTTIPVGLPQPVEPGYKFDGWYYDEACTNLVYAFKTIESDVTLYAKWTALNYNIIYNNNGHGQSVNQDFSNKLPNNLPVLNEDGYEFNGWYTDSALTTKAEGGSIINENTTLYASWTLITYKVTYENNGLGEALASEYLVRLPDSLPVLATDGAIFDGWYMDAAFTEKAIPGSVLSESVTLYAKWHDFTTTNKVLSNYTSANGYLNNNISNFSQYENTNAYVKVSTPDEFLAAIKKAKSSVTNTWDSENSKVVQTVNSRGTVNVIEIMNDLNLGYNLLSQAAKDLGIVDNYVKNFTPKSQMVLENGISQIKIESISNLLIFSKNGAKLTHAGFKLTSCHNVVFRNLSMDEIWEWEDTSSKTESKIGDYDKFGWAYFKISHCGQIWIDHMEFGKSYDGQIDYANPVSNTDQTKFRLALDSDGTNGLHISNCNFNGGSDDKDGYLYKMMEAIEADYQAGNSNYLYYKALRDGGVSFEQILYGLAIPQKKGVLLGDGVDVSKPDFEYNYKMRVSFVNCKFIN
ncbi:MAG: InlB B-repeat-containing protein, partial [Acholeplasmatales bacterium]|nr:InlB B-repeat-containing protein [Acholeplasmatales bacterium]